jgi:hypothetical protein
MYLTIFLHEVLFVQDYEIITEHHVVRCIAHLYYSISMIGFHFKKINFLRMQFVVLEVT